MRVRGSVIAVGLGMVGLALGCGEGPVGVEGRSADGWRHGEGVALVAGQPPRALKTRVAVPFVPNAGQWSDEVAFQAAHFAGSLAVTRDGALALSLLGPVVDDDVPGSLAFGPVDVGLSEVAQGSVGGSRASLGRGRVPRARAPGWTIVERFVDGSPSTPRGLDEAVTRVSYFLGADETRWVSDARTYGAVTLGEVWPGVEVRLQAYGDNVEKLFHVAPGRDPSVIQMALEGALAWRVSDEGALVVRTGNGVIAFSAPVAFQEVAGTRKPVAVRYVVSEVGYRFEVGGYDERLPLVIDPLLQSTYLGGSGDDPAFALAVASDGSVLLTGVSASLNHPTVGGAVQPALHGAQDIVVARLSADLTRLLHATYLGGSGVENGNAIAVDGAGNVLVVADTSSTDFPGTTGGAQPHPGGGAVDAVVSRLSGDLTTLLQSTYLGGAKADYGYAIRVDPEGRVVVAGASASTDFPGTAGGAQATAGGADSTRDVIVSRLDADLTTLLQSTYLGGANDDVGYALLTDDGGVWVAGYSRSTDFPATAGGAQSTSGGAADVVVARLTPDLKTLLQSTYLGGAWNEHGGHALALDAGGNVLVVGLTGSHDYPGTVGGAQAAHGGVPGDDDGVVSRLSGDLTTLLQSTYLGGSSRDYLNDIAVDASGDVLVAGESFSTDFPGTAGGAQETHGGGYADVVIARLSGDLTTLRQSTYAGGEGADSAAALAIDQAGHVVIAGWSSSTTYPGTAEGAQAVLGGAYDAVVSRLTAGLEAGRCGDGVVEQDEACDDGNEADNDGCGGECEVEDGYSCDGQPSVCEVESSGGDDAGTLEPCDDDAGPVEPGDDDAGPVEPGDDDVGTVEPGDDDAGTVEPGDDDAGPVEPGDDDAGTVQPGDDDAGPVEPGDDDAGTVEPGDDDAGPVEPGDDDAGTVQPGDDDAGPVEPGDDDAGTVQPGGDDAGALAPPQDAGSPPGTPSGCGCGAAPTPDVGLLALGVGLLLLRRHRRLR